jgi:hypothetical protein
MADAEPPNVVAADTTVPPPPPSPDASERSYLSICQNLGLVTKKHDRPSSNAGTSSGEDEEGSSPRVSPRKTAKVDYRDTAGGRKQPAEDTGATTGKKTASTKEKISTAPRAIGALGGPAKDGSKKVTKAKTKKPTDSNKAASSTNTTNNTQPMLYRKRGAGFSLEETLDLLVCIEEVIPIGPAMWDRVCDLHAGKWSSQGRNVDSIRRKFKKLAGEKVPTGDPLCPEEIRRAKHIYREMEQKMDAAEEMSDYELGFPGDEKDGDSAEKATNTTTTVESPNPIRRMRTPRTTTPGGASGGGESIMQVMMAKMLDDGKVREEREERRKEDRRLEEQRYREERTNRERIEREEKERRDRRDEDEKKRSDMMTMMMMTIMAKMNGDDKVNDKDKAT